MLLPVLVLSIQLLVLMVRQLVVTDSLSAVTQERQLETHLAVLTLEELVAGLVTKLRS
jgi:predicted transcriptional regulator